MLGDGGDERGDAGRIVAFHQQQAGIRLTRDQRFRNACLLQQTSGRPNRQYRLAVTILILDEFEHPAVDPKLFDRVVTIRNDDGVPEH